MLPPLKKRAQEREVALKVRRFHQSKNKIQKIQNADVWIYDRCWFGDLLPVQYMVQWGEFPNPATHDDGPDSSVSGVMIFEKKGKVFGF